MRGTITTMPITFVVCNINACLCHAQRVWPSFGPLFCSGECLTSNSAPVQVSWANTEYSPELPTQSCNPSNKRCPMQCGGQFNGKGVEGEVKKEKKGKKSIQEIEPQT